MLQVCRDWKSTPICALIILLSVPFFLFVFVFFSSPKLFLPPDVCLCLYFITTFNFSIEVSELSGRAGRLVFLCSLFLVPLLQEIWNKMCVLAVHYVDGFLHRAKGFQKKNTIALKVPTTLRNKVAWLALFHFPSSFDWKKNICTFFFLCMFVCSTINRVVRRCRDPLPPTATRDRTPPSLSQTLVVFFLNTRGPTTSLKSFYFMFICNHWMLSVPFSKLSGFPNILTRGRWAH